MTDVRGPGIHLTPQQLKAMRTDRHLSVTANAGSGKTRILVERYLQILLSGSATVREIVALTYTEKAAGELKRKIADEIAARLAESEDPRLTRILEAVRDDLASATIGTIHAFCSRILREHPVEADIDAAFAVIEGLDQRTLLEEAIADTFRRILAPEGNHELRPDTLELVRALGRAFVIRFVATMAERRNELNKLDGPAGIYRRTDAEILSLWREHLRRFVELHFADTTLRDDLHRIAGTARGKQAGDVREQVRVFLETQDFDVRANVFGSMTEHMLTQRGELRLSFVGSKELRDTLTEETRRTHSLVESVTPLLPLVTGTITDPQHLLLIIFTRTLLAIVREAEGVYERRKRDAGQLDFEDLQLKTRQLMELDSVRKQLQARIAFVMVDEYQDTNQLQYEILLPLLDGLTRGNLFIVGDPKQSIYRFRQANVEIFDRTRQDIESRSGIESNVTLNESFRPLRDLAAFVNLVFSRLLRRDRSGDIPGADGGQVGYDALVRSRQNGATGRVEVLMAGEGNEQGLSEANMITRRIVDLVNSGHTVFDKVEHPRPARFSDIAILLRMRTVLPELEQTMLREGIPYAVHSGVGYFQTQDILDVYGYLAFLLNPADDVSLAGVLRSPFFNVSDAELFEVGFERGPGSFWDHLTRIVTCEGTPDSIRRAVAILHEDAQVALRFPVPELITRILDRTHYASSMAGTPRGPQARANLEKLHRIARAYDVQGFASLYDFVRRLRGLIQEEEREGQGSVDETRDAVQIMTVHAAKGLEFPIVILPYLHRGHRREQEFFIDEHLGVGFSTPGESGKKIRAPLTTFLEQRNRSRDDAEERRIFYVACTRAKDMLILSVGDATQPSPSSPAGWLLSCIAPGGVGHTQRLEFSSSTGALEFTDGDFVPSTIQHTLPIHIVRPSDLTSGQEMIPPPSVDEIARPYHVGAIPVRGGSEIFSATKLRTYIECPSRYFLRYVLGFPAGGGPFVRADDDEMRDRNLPADLRGRIVHAVAQHLAPTVADNETIRLQVSLAIARESSFGITLGQPAFAEISSMIERLVDSAIWKEMSRGTETRTEFTLSVPFAKNFLTGTLDRVYRDPSGTVTIVDYKTDAIDRRLLEERGSLYWPQLEFYGLVASIFFHVPVVQTILLFSNQVETPLRRVYQHADLHRIRSEITKTIGQIQSNEFKPKTAPCPGCPFSPSGCKEIIWRAPKTPLLS